MAEKYLKLYHSDRTVKTLAQYMEKVKIPTSRISVKDLFNQNRQLIFNQMSVKEMMDYATEIKKNVFTADDLREDMTLPCPCVLQIKATLITRELAISQTNFEVLTDNVYAFQDEFIDSIVQNQDYVIDKSTRKFRPDCSVWGWFKSKYYVGGYDGFGSTLGIHRNDQDVKFTDISKFVINLSTQVSAQGGTFSITLPIINSYEQLKKVYPYKSDKKDDIVNVMSNYLSYTDKTAEQQDIYSFGDKSQYFYHRVGLNHVEQNFFNWLIQSNDLLFMSFETLELEKTVSGKVFDMIGLVDDVTVSVDANGSGTVTVTGRDLMKLLFDDSCLFFNVSTAWGPSQIFSNTESMNKQGDITDADVQRGRQAGPLNRIRNLGTAIDVFAHPFNRSIDFVMKGVISQLANIEVVPSTIFENWGNRRTRFAELYPDASFNTAGGGGGNGGSGNGLTGEGLPQLNNTDFNSGVDTNPNKGMLQKEYEEQGGTTGVISDNGVPASPVEENMKQMQLPKDLQLDLGRRFY